MKKHFLTPLLIPALLLLMPGLLRAEEITTTDGQVMKSSSMRRSGDAVMIKMTTPDGGIIEMGLPVSRITKVSFPEPPELAKALDAASSADALGVIALTGDYLSKNGEFKDLPGSCWPQMAQVRLLALAASGKDAEAADLAREIGVLKNPSLGSLYRGGALLGPLLSNDNEAVVVGARGLPSVGGGPGSALAQFALGRALLMKKDPTNALRAFLTIKVFYPSIALLQPASLRGAADAYLALKDEKHALESLQEISDTYPMSIQAAEAKKTAAGLSSP
jgi:hypothetical protein